MLIYKNSRIDACFNLAAEQYLLDKKLGEIFMLWRNSNSVIIGKNQNAYSELDVGYVNENKINVVRRLTGGGAVFHDIGNINFTFIVPSEENATLDFARFTQPIIEAIKSLGAEDVCLSGRNDILINGSKISGNAQTLYNGKTLHHGTLLYDSDLSMLVGALKVDEEKIKSKGIKSVRNRVTNIKDFIKNKMSTEEFMDYLEKYIVEHTDAEIVEFSDEDIANIQKLSDEKYSTWEWNFGKSKEFVAEKKKRFDFGTVCVNLTAEHGVIKDIKIYGDFFGSGDISQIEKLLNGVILNEEAIKDKLVGIQIEDYIMGMTHSDLAKLIIS